MIAPTMFRRLGLVSARFTLSIAVAASSMLWPKPSHVSGHSAHPVPAPPMATLAQTATATCTATLTATATSTTTPTAISTLTPTATSTITPVATLTPIATSTVTPTTTPVPITTVLPAAWSWTQLTANGAAGAPPARQNATVVWDPADRELLVYGGTDTSSSTAMSDLWAYSPAKGTWTQLVASNAAPAGRFGAAGVWDTAGNRL